VKRKTNMCIFNTRNRTEPSRTGRCHAYDAMFSYLEDDVHFPNQPGSHHPSQTDLGQPQRMRPCVVWLCLFNRSRPHKDFCSVVKKKIFVRLIGCTSSVARGECKNWPRACAAASSKPGSIETNPRYGNLASLGPSSSGSANQTRET
jgi:hypothetical protein